MNIVSHEYKIAATKGTNHCELSSTELESNEVSLGNAFDESESSYTEIAFTNGNLPRDEIKISFMTEELETEARQPIAF